MTGAYIMIKFQLSATFLITAMIVMPAMSQDTLTHYGLLEDDTNNASDHLPIVADFKFTQEQEETVLYNIRKNDEIGIPFALGQTVTVDGVVTSANDLGYNGPAYIQDNYAPPVPIQIV